MVIEEVQKRLASSDEEVREKRRWARLMKAKGDFCLMAGSPQDAHEHYRWGGGEWAGGGHEHYRCVWGGTNITSVCV